MAKIAIKIAIDFIFDENYKEDFPFKRSDEQKVDRVGAFKCKSKEKIICERNFYFLEYILKLFT